MNATIVFIILTTLMIVLYDSYCWYHGIPTISSTVRRWGREYPYFALIVGLCMSFLWWHFFVQGD